MEALLAKEISRLSGRQDFIVFEQLREGLCSYSGGMRERTLQDEVGEDED